MKSHTSEFKEEIKTLGKQQSVRITYTLNNEQIILTDEDINSATPNYEASLLKSVMKVLELDSNVSIPKGTEIKFEYGLLVNGVYEYLNYGNYIVAKEPEKQEDTLSYKITCYDKMLYSMKDYEHIEVNYPCKIKKFLIELCKKIGLEFKDSTFANQDREFANELFMTINEDGTYSSMGYTYRDVLDQIAETTGGCICITLDDKVEVRYINKALEYSTSKNTNEVEIETQVKEKVKTININGNSYQETTEGYNLFDKSTANIGKTLNAQGELQGDSGSGFSTSDYIQIEPNTNYYLYNILPTYYVRTCAIYDDNKNFIKTVSLTGSNVVNLLILTPANAKYIRITYKTSDVDIVQVTKGTNLLPYEPYTGGIPSPSPDYTQEITNVGGYDNLFDKNNIISGSYVSDSNGAFVSNSTSKRTDYLEIQASSYYYIYSDKTTGNWGAWYDKDKKFISGITLGGQKEGTVNSPANAKYIAFTISYQGNLTDYSKIKINETAIKIKQSGKNLFDKSAITKGYELYAISGQALSNPDWYVSDYTEVNKLSKIHLSSTGKTKGNANCFYDKDKNFISYQAGINNVSLSVPENAYYLRFNGLITQLDNDIQIEKGTEATSYEPYHEPIITPIDLQGNTLAKVGNVKDILKVNRNGEVEIKKNTWEETINGTDFITLSNNNKALAFYTSRKKLTGGGNDNYLVTNAQINQTFNDGTVYQNPANFVFVGSPTDTLETIKAKFNGGKILYQLATPQTITLPSISPIELWQGTNIFSLVTNLDTEIELEYPTNYDTIDEEYINDTNVNFGEKYRTY